MTKLSNRKPKDKTPQIQPTSDEENPSEPPVVSKFIAEFYSGVIPPPEHLREYELILPGSADRLITMAEKQSKHRQNLETITIKSDIRLGYLGWFSTTLITVIQSLIAYKLISSGQLISGIVLIVAVLAIVAGIYFFGSRAGRKEREGKMAPPVEQLPEKTDPQASLDL